MILAMMALAVSGIGEALAVPLDPQETLFKNRFNPKTTSSEWGTENNPDKYAYHALAAIYGWKRHKLGHSFGTTFGTDAIDLKTAAILAADRIVARVQTAGWAAPAGTGWEQENGFQTGMAAWALAEVGGILLQYGSDTTKANSYLNLANSRLASATNGFKDKSGYQCGSLNGVNYDHDTYSHWNGCGNGSTVFCSYWSIYDAINGITCTSGRRWIKNRNVVMGVASLSYNKYKPSDTSHRERGERSIRSQAAEIGTGGTSNTDFYGKADANYGTKPWDDHNWAEVVWMLHAGELISRFNSSVGADRIARAKGHYIHMRNNGGGTTERKARAGCHFARHDATAWTDCSNYNTSSIQDTHAYGLVVDETL